METWKARRSWTEVLKTLKNHRYQPGIVCAAKLSATIDGENKTFHDKNQIQTQPYRRHWKENSHLITGESIEKYKILLCELASFSIYTLNKYPTYSEKLTVLLLSYKYWLHEDRVVKLRENMRWTSKVHAHELTPSLGVRWLTQEETG